MNWRKDRLLRFGFLTLGLWISGPAPASVESGFAELYLRAQQANIDVIRNAYDARISEEVIDEARSALLPQVTVSGGRAWQDPKQPLPTGPEGTIDQYEIRVSQRLFDLSAWSNLERSGLGRDVADLQLENIRADVLLSLMRLSVEYLRQQELLEVTDQELASLETQLRQAERMHEAGMIVVTSVHEARSRMDQALSARLGTVREIQQVEQQIYDLVRDRTFRIDQYVRGLKITRPDQLSFADLAQQEASANLELQLAKKRVDLDKKTLETSRYEHYPVIELSATQSDDSIPSRFSERQRALTVSLNVPIYLGGSVTSRVSQSRLRLEQQEEIRDYTKYQLNDRVRNIKENSEILVEQYRLLIQAQESANKAFMAVEAGFRAGERNTIDVLNAQNDLYAVRRSLIVINYELVDNYIRMYDNVNNVDLDFAESIFL